MRRSDILRASHRMQHHGESAQGRKAAAMLNKTGVLVLLVSAVLAVPQVRAQDYPDRLIRFIVAYPAGATELAA